MEKVFEKIPDVWFDIYARFIPGFVFVLACRTIIYQDVITPPWNQLLFMMLLAYLAGHIIQPLSSLLARTLEYRVFDKRGNIKKCKELYQGDTRELRLLSKQHAECTCFTGLFLLTIVFYILLVLTKIQGHDLVEFLYLKQVIILSLVYFTICSLLRAHAVAGTAKSFAVKNTH